MGKFFFRMSIFLYIILVTSLVIPEIVQSDILQPIDQTKFSLSVANEQSFEYQNQNYLQTDDTNYDVQTRTPLNSDPQTIINTLSENELELNIEKIEMGSEPKDSILSNSALTNENLYLGTKQGSPNYDNYASPTIDGKSYEDTPTNSGEKLAPDNPQVGIYGLPMTDATNVLNEANPSESDLISLNNIPGTYDFSQLSDSSPQQEGLNFNNNANTPIDRSLYGGMPTNPGEQLLVSDNPQIGTDGLPMTDLTGGQNEENPILYNSMNNAPGTYDSSQFPDLSSQQKSPMFNNNGETPVEGNSNGNILIKSGENLPNTELTRGQNGANPREFNVNSIDNTPGTYDLSQLSELSPQQEDLNFNNNANTPVDGSLYGDTLMNPEEQLLVSDNTQIRTNGLLMTVLTGGQNGANPSRSNLYLIDNTPDTYDSSQLPDLGFKQESPSFNNNANTQVDGSLNGGMPTNPGEQLLVSDNPQIGTDDLPVTDLTGIQSEENPIGYNSINNAPETYDSFQLSDLGSQPRSSNISNHADTPIDENLYEGTQLNSGVQLFPDYPKFGVDSSPNNNSTGEQNGVNSSGSVPNLRNNALGNYDSIQLPDSGIQQESLNMSNNANTSTDESSYRGTPINSGVKSDPDSPQFGVNSLPINGSTVEQNGVNSSGSVPNLIIQPKTCGDQFICDKDGNIIGVVLKYSEDIGKDYDSDNLNPKSVIGDDIYQPDENAVYYVRDETASAYYSSKDANGDVGNVYDTSKATGYAIKKATNDYSHDIHDDDQNYIESWF